MEQPRSGDFTAAGAITRRRLVQIGAGAGLAGAALGTLPRARTARAFAPQGASIPGPPNIVVLMTDQERHHMHWPSGWAEKNLPGLQRLKRHGLYFNRAYTAACQCSPSRALMMTGRFAPANRVTRTFLWPGLVHQSRQPNIASLLREKAGYEVVWKGKWHLSYAVNAALGNGGEDWTAADVKAMEVNYGWSDWNPPDAGNAIQQWQPTEFGKFNGIATLGGGDTGNDGRYVDGRATGLMESISAWTATGLSTSCIKGDPGQMDNLLYGEPASGVRKKWSRLHRILTRCFIDTGNLPDGFAWPIEPVRV